MMPSKTHLWFSVLSPKQILLAAVQQNFQHWLYNWIMSSDHGFYTPHPYWLHICPTFGNWINNTIKRWNPCNDLKCLKWKNEHSINDQLTDCKISLFWQLLLYIIVHKAFVVTFVTLLYIFNVLVLMPWYLLPSCKTLPSFHWKWRSSPDASTVRVVDAPVATDLLSGCWGKSLSGKYQL